MQSVVFGDGTWLWVWPAARAVDPAAVVAECHAVGARGLIVHAVGASKPALDWLARASALTTGLETAVAVGSRGPTRWDTALANPAINALKAGQRVMLDAEGSWDGQAGEPAARQLVDKVLGAVDNAFGRVADCAWYAPDLHRGFPLQTFGLLCATRAPQCYAASPSAALAHARREYPLRHSLASAVIPTVRGYARQVAEVTAFALAEPHALYWLGSRADKPNELTDDVRRGLQAAAKIRASGHATVADYQRAAGLVPDGVCGRLTLQSLGVL